MKTRFIILCLLTVGLVAQIPLFAQNQWVLKRNFAVSYYGSTIPAQGQAFLYYGTYSNGEVVIDAATNRINVPVVDGVMEMTLPNFPGNRYGVLMVVPDVGVFPQFTPHMEASSFLNFEVPTNPEAYIVNMDEPLTTLHYQNDSVPVNHDMVTIGGIKLAHPSLMSYGSVEAGYISKETAHTLAYPALTTLPLVNLGSDSKEQDAVIGSMIRIGVGGAYFKLPEDVTSLDISFFSKMMGPGFTRDNVDKFVLMEYRTGKILKKGNLASRSVSFAATPASEFLVILYESYTTTLSAPKQGVAAALLEEEEPLCEEIPDASTQGHCDVTAEVTSEYEKIDDSGACVDADADGRWDPPPEPTPTVVAGSVSLCRTTGSSSTTGGSVTVSGEYGVGAPVGPTWKVGVKGTVSHSGTNSTSSAVCSVQDKFIGFTLAQLVTKTKCCYECVVGSYPIPGGDPLQILEFFCTTSAEVADPTYVPCEHFNEPEEDR